MSARAPEAVSAPARGIVEAAVAQALAEDLGLAGDVTSRATIGEEVTAGAALIARKSGVICGLPVADAAFAAVDAATGFRPLVSDGARVAAGEPVARIEGTARSLLAAERVALNFLCHLSGIATLTRAYVEAAAGTTARVIDTRKTTPGLRALQKYAVACGGGKNHRFGLFDAVLIKDNHVAACGGVGAAVTAAKSRAGHMVKVEVEIDRLGQLEEALDAGADIVMLDNMGPDLLREAVARTRGRAVLEASGGVTLETVRAIAESGVDLISVGALTHSAPILDLGLDFD